MKMHVNITRELFSITILLITFFVSDYFFLWRPTLNQWQQSKQVYLQKQTEFFKKQAQLVDEKNTIVQLTQWQNHHPGFYRIVSTASTVNQQLSLLNQLIQQAHFQIHQMTNLEKMKNNKLDCVVSLTASGQFFDLFSLMTTLKHFAIPFTLSQLLIDKHNYKMTFILRDCYA